MSDSGLTLYDLNKGAFIKQPKLSDKELEDGIQLINQYAKETNNNFFVLLCKEMSYYTFFCSKKMVGLPVNLGLAYVSKVSIGEEVVNCLSEIGDEILSINKSETDMIECWVRKDEEAFMIAFFSYDIGVIIV